MLVVTFPKRNNLEWLRLIFAIQVVVVHAAEHLQFTIPEIIHRFPGVPAFFFVSGFLIYASYLNAPGFRYYENRFLRLYPGLIFVTFGGGAVALTAHGWHDLINNSHAYIIWILSQLTIAQAYNPSQFRDVGIGVINGSLWTLTVEILFYFSVPIIVWMERRFRYIVSMLIALSFLFYAAGPVIWTDTVYRDKTVYNFISLTPIAWGWMFGFGILAVKHFDFLQRLMKYFPIAIAPIALMIFFGDGLLFGSSGNRVGLVYFICYICLVLWLAFATPYIRLTFDLSYGSYVWHMPIINLLLVISEPSIPLVFLLTFSVSVVSWFLIEKPTLRLKRKSLKL